ncbi:MAG: ATP-dependent nuclease [Armatimonadota bacterium]
MHISKIDIKNFRLLKEVEISLENKTTVIVGRNNSGKTSLTELFWRLLSDKSPSFSLEDFTLSVHDDFWSAFLLFNEDVEESIIRDRLPIIEVRLHIAYDVTPDLGTLSEFIIDLDSNTTSSVVLIRYRLKDGLISKLFGGISNIIDGDITEQKRSFYKIMKERLPLLYTVSLFAVDPTDVDNMKPLELSKLRVLLQAGFINAQRGLDDSTSKEKDVLSRILARILESAASETASLEDQTVAQELEGAVQDIQKKIDTDFKGQLAKLLPALSLFGYPGLNDPKLNTETILDVERLLGNHTKLCYEGSNGIGLPESYNGLGSRNLIYILFQLYEFFKVYKAKPTAPGLHLIFLEEPEAHLHPQMMEVFIRKLSEIATDFADKYNEGQTWPVQFVVTTHSTHIANEAPFESIRYFLCTREGGQHTRIKDLRNGLSGNSFDEDREFLHKYLTLTRCDLFFADKAVLIEGPTERLMLPRMVEKIDADPSNGKLSSQYVSVIEVGGAYAHHFFKLLNFLELRTIIITDLDSVDRNGGSKCKVAEGTHISNACIKKWFNDNDISPATLIAKSEDEKIIDFIRLAFQIPESGSDVCGRSFEDAFMLANTTLFEIEGATDAEKVDDAWSKASKVDKTDFAIEYALDKTNWVVPAYIMEGLIWLAKNPHECISEVAVPTPLEAMDDLVGVIE